MTDKNLKITDNTKINIEEDQYSEATTKIFSDMDETFINFIELAKTDTPKLIEGLAIINTVIIDNLFENPKDIMKRLCNILLNNIETSN